MNSQYKPWDTNVTVKSRNEAYKNSAKIIEKIAVRQRGGHTITSLNTPMH